MKIKTNQVLTNLAGKPLQEDNVEVTLGMVMSASLLNHEQETDQKQAYGLARRILNEPEVDLKIEEIAFVKERLKASKLSTLIIGQALTLLDI